MASFLVTNNPALPQSPVKSIRTTFSLQTSMHSENSTPKSRIKSVKSMDTNYSPQTSIHSESSTSQSPVKSIKSTVTNYSPQTSTHSENSIPQSPVKSIVTNDSPQTSIYSENSTPQSPIKSIKSLVTTFSPQTSIHSENSISKSRIKSVKSMDTNYSSQTSTHSENSEPQSPVKSIKSIVTTFSPQTSIQSENSIPKSRIKSVKSIGSNYSPQTPIHSENSTPQSPVKPIGTNYCPRTSIHSENSRPQSPVKSIKSTVTNYSPQTSTHSENSRPQSPVKSVKSIVTTFSPQTSIVSENSISKSRITSVKSIDTNYSPQTSVHSENSRPQSPVKSIKSIVTTFSPQTSIYSENSTSRSPVKSVKSVVTNYSPQTSIHSEYLTPQSSIQHSQTSTDSESTLSNDDSSSDDSYYEEFMNKSPTKHVHFDDLLEPQISIDMKLENDEVEFFAVVAIDNTISPIHDKNNNINKPIRKRDKIRAMFHNRFHRSHSISSDTDPHEWNQVLAKTLVSMRHDIEDIIAGFDDIDQPIEEKSPSNTSDLILTTPRLSFRERQQAKIQMMRMAQMFHPPNLLTCNIKESPYPYTDIVDSGNFHFFGNKSTPAEMFFVQHKPFQHKKFRYRTQRGLLKMRHDLEKMKHDLYGKSIEKTHRELPSHDVQNYRSRLEKTLLEVRTQISEYDRVHALTNNHRPSISQIISSMKKVDPEKQAQIDDYRSKLRPTEYTEEKDNHELVSAPFIPRRAPYRPNNIKKDIEKDNQIIDPRFDRTTFIDLNKEADIFFGTDEQPFWNQPENLKLSASPLPARRR
ncbi:unnamed protein product [Adineta steineri]|uniref:Uncharacterized protein n=1 Tax=Adineta steineri TaxID=433720 RepID=A0A814GTE1_9BILA|nr:unnamed protein product [Adineta steineri]CAF1303074.1 unnamed protein product [Adineta steineri]